MNARSNYIMLLSVGLGGPFLTVAEKGRPFLTFRYCLVGPNYTLLLRGCAAMQGVGVNWRPLKPCLHF